MPVMVGIIPNEILSNNTKIPVLGFGPPGFNDQPGVTSQMVKDAIDLGYRYIDISPVGVNEAEIGEAIAAKIKEGVVKREELYLVGKLWDAKVFHNPALIKPALLATLRKLNVAYIDMYVINCPDLIGFSDEELVDTWYEMENLVDHFLVKSIGLSNFNSEQIHHLLIGARFSPACNQIECNPYFQQSALTAYCSQKHIITTAFNVYGSSSELLEDPLITRMAEKYKTTPDQILLRYQIDKGHVTVPEVTNKSGLMRNLDVFKFQISKRDIGEMDTLVRHKEYI